MVALRPDPIRTAAPSISPAARGTGVLFQDSLAVVALLAPFLAIAAHGHLDRERPALDAARATYLIAGALAAAGLGAATWASLRWRAWSLAGVLPGIVLGMWYTTLGQQVGGEHCGRQRETTTFLWHENVTEYPCNPTAEIGLPVVASAAAILLVALIASGILRSEPRTYATGPAILLFATVLVLTAVGVASVLLWMEAGETALAAAAANKPLRSYSTPWAGAAALVAVVAAAAWRRRSAG